MDHLFKICLISTLLISAVSCNKKKNLNEFSLNQTSRPYNELKELALKNGDTIAYHELSIAYMDSPNDDKFLFVALFMANKHNYPLAYEDVYYVLTDYYHKKEFTELDDLDDKTRELALEYLKAGAEKGNKQCKWILSIIYEEGRFLEKNEELANRLKQESGK